MKRILNTVLAVFLLCFAGLAFIAIPAQADNDHDDKKVVVCKYIGTPPGTPDHIIVVSASAIKDWDGETFPWTFADAQDSVAIRYAVGNEQPGDEELVNCPGYEPPTHDECPDLIGDQPEGTDCSPPPPPPHDECDNIPGDQPEGTDCSPEPPCAPDYNGETPGCGQPPEEPTDVCPNLTGVQDSMPPGLVTDEHGDCVFPPPPCSPDYNGDEPGCGKPPVNQTCASNPSPELCEKPEPTTEVQVVEQCNSETTTTRATDHEWDGDSWEPVVTTSVAVADTFESCKPGEPENPVNPDEPTKTASVTLPNTGVEDYALPLGAAVVLLALGGYLILASRRTQ